MREVAAAASDVEDLVVGDAKVQAWEEDGANEGEDVLVWMEDEEKMSSGSRVKSL